MNICIIPARGGSKRIPRKNIKKFAKHIFQYYLNGISLHQEKGCNFTVNNTFREKAENFLKNEEK